MNKIILLLLMNAASVFACEHLIGSWSCKESDTSKIFVDLARLGDKDFSFGLRRDEYAMGNYIVDNIEYIQTENPTLRQSYIAQCSQQKIILNLKQEFLRVGQKAFIKTVFFADSNSLKLSIEEKNTMSTQVKYRELSCISL